MGIEHPKYKVAVVQAAPAWPDLDASIDKSIALIREAAEKGAKLIAFPEAFIPGYPWHIWMDSPAWAIGRGFVQRYFDNSLSYDSAQAERLRDAVRKAKLTAVLGLIMLVVTAGIVALANRLKLGGGNVRLRDN